MLKWVKKEYEIIFLIFFDIIIFFPFMGRGFLSDDFMHIYHVLKTKSLINLFQKPGPFGLYRPVSELFFLINYELVGLKPLLYGVTNFVFHLLNIVLVYILIKKLNGSKKTAILTALIFSLTPKAHSIAVNWISARTSILMTFFALLSLISWIEWRERRANLFYITALLLYAVSILSKESGVLLPVLFIIIPFNDNNYSEKLKEIMPFIVVLILIFALRIKVGALMPFSGDEHYNYLTSLGIVALNLKSYFFRAIPSPILVIFFLGVPLFLKIKKRIMIKEFYKNLVKIYELVFSFLWFLVFITPVLPIKMRSELYLYVAGMGFCFLSGKMVFEVVNLFFYVYGSKGKRFFYTFLFITLLIGGGYVAGRNYKASKVSSFSNKLICKLKSEVKLNGEGDFLYLIPEDEKTENLVKSSFQGYFDVIVKLIFERDDIYGRVKYEGDFSEIKRKKIVYLLYKDGDVLIKIF